MGRKSLQLRRVLHFGWDFPPGTGMSGLCRMGKGAHLWDFPQSGFQVLGMETRTWAIPSSPGAVTRAPCRQRPPCTQPWRGSQVVPPALPQLKNNPRLKKRSNSPDADVLNWAPLWRVCIPKACPGTGLQVLPAFCWETTDSFIFRRMAKQHVAGLPASPRAAGPDPAPRSRDRCHRLGLIKSLNFAW